MCGSYVIVFCYELIATVYSEEVFERFIAIRYLNNWQVYVQGWRKVVNSGELSSQRDKFSMIKIKSLEDC